MRGVHAATTVGPSQAVGGATIELRGLEKSFRGPEGVVRAVRGIDVSIARGETVALLGPNGAGKSTTIDMLLGLLHPDGGSVSLFGHAPRTAVDLGLVGGNAADRAADPRPRRARAHPMVASLYPAPLDVDEVIALVGIGDIVRATHAEAVGRPDPARALRRRAGQRPARCSCSTSRRWRMDVEARHAFWTTMRDFAARGKTVIFATHYLEEADAYADRAVLMAHGMVVADGPTTEIKARVGLRTIRATLPGVDAPGPAASCRASARPSAAGRRWCCAARDSDAAIRVLLDRYPQARDIEITGAGLEEAFLELTSGEDAGGVRSLAYTRFELLRTVRNRRLLVFSLGFPITLYFLIAGPQPEQRRLRRHRPVGAAVLHDRAGRLRHDVGDDRLRRAHRRRAQRRLDAPAADHAADDARLLPRQGDHRLRDGAGVAGGALPVRGLARRQPRRPAGGWR